MTITTGNVRESSGSALSVASTAQPSMPGIMTSRVMAAGRTRARQRETLLARGRGDDPEAFLREEARQQVVDDGIVVDHEHRALRGTVRRWSARSALPSPAADVFVGALTTVAGSRTVKVEPSAEAALDGDLAAHHLGRTAG